MCDTFAALSSVTKNKHVLFGKSADCEVNEANAIVRIPGSKHLKGEAVRLTHLVIPQAEVTHEIFLTKAFWTYGCEVGVNEFGLAMGEEAVFTRDMSESKDGIIGPDLMRLGLERAWDCSSAIEIMTALLEEYGQGGSAELKGNSHFDSSFLMADQHQAYIMETSGRNWAVKKIEEFDSISNMLGISTNWTKCSIPSSAGKLDWAKQQAKPEVPPTLGSPDRQSITYNCLKTARNQITTRTMFDTMRHHNPGYHPGTAPAHQNICVHVGPQENRWWQADGAMITDVNEDDVLIWVTGTSGNCVSVFKPVFLGLDIPEIGPVPTEHFDPRSMWWKHELLHRRAMADFDQLVPEIRKDFDVLEDEFLAAAEIARKGTSKGKQELMEYAFHKSQQAADLWIERLSSRSNLKFEDAAYGAVWKKLNAEAGLSLDLF